MDDTDSSVTERIRQEKDSWGEFQQTMLRDGVLPCLNEVAGVMAEVNKSIMVRLLKFYWRNTAHDVYF